MENKINIAELLKDCPNGMELDCTMFDNAKFIGVENYDKPICIRIGNGDLYFHLTKFGTWNFDDNAKCLIYPKGKTTWEGFVPPCKFKNGDIIYVKDKYNKSWCSILNNCENNNLYTYVDICIDSNTFYSASLRLLCNCKDMIEYRLATEEEKEKLFQVIKDNGYRWDAETKTLEKLTEPKFKDGDVVTYKYENGLVSMILNKFVNFVEVHYHCALYDSAKGFVTNNYIVGEPKYTRLATEEEKEKLFKAIKDNGYQWNAETKTLEKLVEPKFKVGDKVRPKKGISEPRIIKDVCDTFYTLVSVGKIDFTDQNNWELVPNKFDINTLVLFESKVLVRDGDREKWCPAIWGFYNDSAMNYPYECIGGAFAQCIPYEGNEHLLGTDNECNEHYKTWK